MPEFRSVGVGLLWYTASDPIKFLGLLATSVIALFGVIGALWPSVKDIRQFLRKRHLDRGRLFYKTALITNFVAFLLCCATITWGFDPYTHLGWQTLSSSLSNPNDYYWHDQLAMSTSGDCSHNKDGTYHVTAIPHFSHYCVATATDFSDFIYEVQMKFIKGDCGGIVFRVDRASDNVYTFDICQKQTYCLYRFIGPFSTGETHDLIGCNGQPGDLPSLLKDNNGITRPVTLAVEARGEKFVLWVNHHILDEGFDFSDQELEEGEIGVTAVAGNHPTEVAFSNARVWISNGS